VHLILGSDRSGFSLRRALEPWLREQGWAITVLGPEQADQAVPFYEVAAAAARAVQAGAERAVLICGTGMGMAQVAGKFQGVRAACAESVYSAKMARAVNDSNVLCLGGWLIAPELAKEMTRVFLRTEFTEGLEEWRGAWLQTAKETIAALEAQLYCGQQEVT
jgi:ribose 5-phosphate isomerase B